MKLIKITAAALATLAFTACQSPTPYKSASKSDTDFGYQSKKVTDDIYRVSFKGNDSTSKSTVEKYMLYRAAEVAKRNKAPYFEVVSRDTNKIVEYDRVYTNTAFTRPYTTGFAGYDNYRYPYYSYGYGWGPNEGRAQIIKEDLYSTVAYVKLRDSAPKNVKVFNTNEVVSRLQKDIK